MRKRTQVKWMEREKNKKENGAERDCRISEDVCLEDEFNKVELTAGGLKLTQRLNSN